jgi:hypothetical protein
MKREAICSSEKLVDFYELHAIQSERSNYSADKYYVRVIREPM